MLEGSEIPLGPSITRVDTNPKQEEKKTFFPYDEQKKKLIAEMKAKGGHAKYDVLVVFGEGPVKDVYFKTELAANDPKLVTWDEFTKDPKRQKEPDFFIIDDTTHGAGADSKKDRNPFYSQLEEIRTSALPTEEKTKKIDALRKEYQQMGVYAQRRWGEFNARAAAQALYMDLTDKVILTGGRTLNNETKTRLRVEFLAKNPDVLLLPYVDQNQRFNSFIADKYPSEAELMRDIIVRTVGKKMFFEEAFKKKFSVDELQKDYQTQTVDQTFEEFVGDKKRSFENSFSPQQLQEEFERYKKESLLPRIIIEDEALTTPENVVYSVNKHPDLFAPGKKVASLPNEHQRERATGFLQWFAGVQEIGQMPSQILLEERAQMRNKEKYRELMHFFHDDDTNQDLVKRASGDHEKAQRLENPKKLLYWFGHLGMLDDGARIQNVISEVQKKGDETEQQRWKKAVALAFERAGILYSSDPATLTDPNNFYVHDIGEVQKNNPDLFRIFKSKLSVLVDPAHRDVELEV